MFCCLPVGIASIVFASQVDGKWAGGDYIGAREASEKAKKFAIIAAAAAAAAVLLYFIVIIGLLASSRETGY
jgi:hypothetical protein